MTLPKRLTRDQAEPLCEYYCTDKDAECFGDCECNPLVQDVWTRLRERLLADVPDDTALLRQALEAIAPVALYKACNGDDWPARQIAPIIAALRERLGEIRSDDRT